MKASFYELGIKGLDKSFFIRNLIIGMIFALIMIGFYSKVSLHTEALSFGRVYFMAVLYTANAVFFPHARFLYKRVMGAIIGQNFVIANAIIYIIWKVVTSIIVFSLAIPLGILGAISLYYYHKNQANL